VQRGGVVRINVTTQPKAAVGYVAYYADGKSGAPAPMGQGYGGNSGNVSDASGHYTDAWTVSVSAPLGTGRVEVLAAKQGAFNDIYVPFRVVGIGGTC
jgi:hypothetical protein